MIKHFTGHVLDSHHVVKTKVENMTGVTQLQIDMCVNSCVAFMGPFKDLDKCPTCDEGCYQENKKTGKQQP